MLNSLSFGSNTTMATYFCSWNEAMQRKGEKSPGTRIMIVLQTHGDLYAYILFIQGLFRCGSKKQMVFKHNLDNAE